MCGVLLPAGTFAARVLQSLDSPYSARLPLKPPGPAAQKPSYGGRGKGKEMATPELIRPSPGNPSRQVSFFLFCCCSTAFCVCVFVYVCVSLCVFSSLASSALTG